MSNCEVVHLPTLVVEPFQVTEVLRCLFHTILFNRALGPVVAREIDAELFEITWPHCGDEAAERRLEGKIAQVHSWVERNKDKRATVRLSFFERPSHSVPSWVFLRQEQRLVWEEWNVTLVPAASFDSEQRSQLEIGLEECIHRIVTAVNEKKDHIPPVVKGSPLTFNFDITVTAQTSGDSSSESSSSVTAFGTELMRRVLSAAQPPSVLH